MKGRNHRNPSGRNERAMAMLGHELDNVLNGLLGMTQLLRESGLSPEQDRWSCAIEQSGRQLRRLVATFRSGAGPVDRSPALRIDGEAVAVAAVVEPIERDAEVVVVIEVVGVAAHFGGDTPSRLRLP